MDSSARSLLGDRVLPVPERVLGRLLLSRAEESPDQEFFRVGEQDPLSLADIAERAQRVAGGLAALGVRRGDRVALLLPTCDEALLAWFGCALLGAVEVPVNTNLSGHLLAHVLRDCGAEVAIVSRGLAELLPDALGGSSIRTVVVAEPVASGQPWLAPPGLTVVPWAEVAAGRPTVEPGLESSDPIAVMYTSGTTGPAKGVVCPHGYFSCWADDTGRAVDFRSGDVLYSPLPMFHITAQAVNIQLALLHRGSVCIDQHFSPTGFWRRMAALRATHVWSFGSMTPLLSRQEPDEWDRAHEVRILWSIPWPAQHAERFEDRFGLRILSGYGSTEQGLTIVQPHDSRIPGTLGRPSPHYDVRVVDEADEPVTGDRPGELVIRPREPDSMMSGYLGRPEETLRAWRNLWYHTGDLVRVRTDGFLEFVERRNDAIRRRGENISAWEIESLVMDLPGVDEAAVVGVAAELGDQDVLLAVTVGVDGPTERALFDHCRERLPYYMVPRYVRILPELPKTPSLRVQKYLLREAGVAEGTWDAEEHGLRVRRPQAV